jgi:hypothetical protein
MRHRTAIAALAALALLAPQAALARGGIAAGQPLGPAGLNLSPTISFWAGEAVPDTDWSNPGTYWNRRDTSAYTPYLWSVLSRYRIPLYFNLRYRRDFGPVPAGRPHRHDGLAIIRKANRLGVPVWGWVLIPYSDGYWAWEGAARQQLNAVKALSGWAREKRVRLQGLAIDPEPPLRTPFEAQSSILLGSTAGLSPLLQGAIDPAGQCRAWHGYERIQRWGSRHGVTIATAPSPIALDDVRDGRLALQDASQFVLPDAPWDEVFVQAYRSVFAYHAGHDPGAGIVSSYLRSSRREFGDAGQVSLGSAGRGSYRRFSSLLHDVRLAATLGARELPIYSLERTLRTYGGPDSLIRLIHAAQRPFAGPRRATASAPTPQATALRAAIRSTDAVATATTPTVTAARGAPQAANRWPGGCGG